jgi:hypothetical protein
MPSFDEPILRMARRVADIKRGRQSIEEKAEAIGSFVTSFLFETQTLRRKAKHSVPLPRYVRSRASVPPSIPPRHAVSKEEKPEPAHPVLEETAESPYPVCAAPVEPLRIIHIAPPIVVKELATELGLEPHQIISELMSFNIFANINQTIETEVAAKICQNHGFALETEDREKGAAREKVEQVEASPSPAVLPARIVTFTVTPTTIVRGESAKLSYKLENAERASIDPSVGEVDSIEGNLSVSPVERTVYTLTMFGRDGVRERQRVTINVRPRERTGPTHEAPKKRDKSSPTPAPRVRDSSAGTREATGVSGQRGSLQIGIGPAGVRMPIGAGTPAPTALPKRSPTPRPPWTIH